MSHNISHEMANLNVVKTRPNRPVNRSTGEHVGPDRPVFFILFLKFLKLN